MEVCDYVRQCSDAVISTYHGKLLDSLIKSCKMHDGLVLPPKDVLCHMILPSVLTVQNFVRVMIDRLYVENLDSTELRTAVIGNTDVTNAARKNVDVFPSIKPKQSFTNYHIVIVIDTTDTPYAKSSALRKLTSTNNSVLLVSEFSHELRTDPSSNEYKILLDTLQKSQVTYYGSNQSTATTIAKSGYAVKYCVSPMLNTDLEALDSETIDVMIEVLCDSAKDCHKILCIVSDRKVATKLNRMIGQRVQRSVTSRVITDPTLLRIKTYTSKGMYGFYDYKNDCASTVLIGNSDQVTSTCSTDIAMLIVTLDDLMQSTDSVIGLRHVDCVMLCNESGLTTDSIRLMDSVVLMNVDNTTVTDTLTDTRLTVIDINRNDMVTQTLTTYNTFYDADRMHYLLEVQSLCTDDDDRHTKLTELKKTYNLECYSKLCRLVDSKIIDTLLNRGDRVKLEKMYGIRKKDYDYIDRHKMMYMNTLTKSRLSMSTGIMHDLEQQYLYIPNKVGKITGYRNNSVYTDKAKLRTEELATEVSMIMSNQLKNYSGPMWLGKDDGTEAQGSMIGFADEDKDTLEVCQILGTYKFTRTYKRQGWTEKENRDRKILFLSPVLLQVPLSDLKKSLKRPTYKKFARMEKIEHPF